MRNKHVLHMVQAALIAAMYVVLTWVANLLRLANGVIQVRFSEALTILPFFTPAAIPGLFVGCIISNTITGSAIWDILFGSLATLIGAFFTYKLAPYQQMAGTSAANFSQYPCCSAGSSHRLWCTRLHLVLNSYSWHR